jgi:hypothetical protein
MKKIIKIIEGEKWYPAVKVTDKELYASELLNKTLDSIVRKIKKLKK